jgi:hypothetical protein
MRAGKELIFDMDSQGGLESLHGTPPHDGNVMTTAGSLTGKGC